MQTKVTEWLETEVKPMVDAHIKSSLAASPYPERLWYPIGTGGKRVRPGLCLLVGRLTGVADAPLLDMAAGIELLHTFTLIHDDIEDGDRTRRGAPALWVREGQPSAINLGDMIFVEGLSLLPGRVRDEALATVREVTEGQQMDLDFEERRDITPEEYVTMARRKTGTLLEFAMQAPQAMANEDLDLAGYEAIGPAYQIRDDLLDLETGVGRERVGNDIRRGKRTLPVVHADDDRLYEILDTDFDETPEADIQEAIEILDREESFVFARQTMQALAEDALAATESLPSSEDTRRLRAITRRFIDRQR